jgi:hypothetical protein
VLPGGQGGEPSIAIDTSPTASRANIYVGAIGDANGPLEWHSYNAGKSWSAPVPFDLNGPLRGGDDDIAVNTNGDLLATDLNVSWASVQISTDQGKTFDAGTQTAPEDDRPWLTAAGNVDVVWYGTAATGEPNGVCGTLLTQSPCKDGFPPYTDPNARAWNVYLAQSTNALSSSPTFTQVAANATPTHYGEICTNGLVCGSSDRSLLDFISVAIDCQGFAHIAYGGNTKQQEAAGQVFVHAANQTSGSALAPPAACATTVH